MQSVAREKRESTRAEDRVRLQVILRAPWVQKPIDRIGKGEIAMWIDEVGAKGNGGKGLAASTLNRYRSLVSVVFEHAVERDIIGVNPARGLKRADETHRAREIFLSREEVLALVRTAPPELSLLLLTAASTGLRQGALRALRWADVDLDAGTLLAKATYAKGKKPQLFKLIPAVVEGLRECRSQMKVRSLEGADAVFRTKTGVAWTRGRLCTAVRAAVDACSQIASEKRGKVTLHTLRHSFASLLAIDGMSTRKLQEAMSHSDATLTGRYAHLDSEAMVEVQQRIGRLLDPQPDQLREGYHRGYQGERAG